ncbi:MAG TPA: hypothetical protein VM680_18880 [Verrucomicrobiae bacterium]|nr:hypothetical protein [Verrucomicrobiae bacterium]
MQEPPPGFTPNVAIQRTPTKLYGKNPPVSAVALDVQGSCKYSTDGKKFHTLKKDMELPRKAVVKTGSSGNAQLFIRRMGATIRLEPNTEVTLERSEQPAKDEHQKLNTKVNVRKGKAVTVMHANIPDSSLDIKTAGGKSVTDPVLGSRYVVSADSVQDAGPETAPAGDYNLKMQAVIKEQMELDEVQALAETWKNDENPGSEP